MLPVGDVFAEKPRALAVSRQAQPGGDGYKRSHAILPTINQAVMRIMYGSGKTRFESIHNSWMLQYDPVTVTPYAEVIKDALYFWNWVYGMGLLIFMCMWWACKFTPTTPARLLTVTIPVHTSSQCKHSQNILFGKGISSLLATVRPFNRL